MRLKPFTLATIGLPLLMFWLLQPVELTRMDSPDSRFVAVVEAARIWQLVPQPLFGYEHSAKISMFDHTGQWLGSVPLSQVSQAEELRWLVNGASIKMAGAWNFSDKFYAHWNRDQTTLIAKSIPYQ